VIVVRKTIERESDLWRTPDALWRELHDEFRFDIDLAALVETSKLDACFAPDHPTPHMRCALSAQWLCAFRRVGFCNPPYSNIEPFVAKAVDEASRRNGFTSVFLLPYSPDVRWWSHVEHAVEIRRIPHRVRFLLRDGRPLGSPTFPSCVVVFRPQPGIVQPSPPRHVTWDYR
jgi:phage N-6-adenine-methyltransferase